MTLSDPNQLQTNVYQISNQSYICQSVGGGEHCSFSVRFRGKQAHRSQFSMPPWPAALLTLSSAQRCHHSYQQVASDFQRVFAALSLLILSCLVGFAPEARIAKLNIDSEPTAQQTVHQTRTEDLEDVLFALRGHVFIGWHSLPSGGRLTACCSRFLTFQLFSFSLLSLNCLPTLYSYCKHTQLIQASLVVQPN